MQIGDLVIFKPTYKYQKALHNYSKEIGIVIEKVAAANPYIQGEMSRVYWIIKRTRLWYRTSELKIICKTYKEK